MRHDREERQRIDLGGPSSRTRAEQFGVSGRRSSNRGPEILYEVRQGDLTMIVEAEWNRRLGRGFNSRRLHHKRSRRAALLRGATWVRLGAVKARLRLG